MDGCISTYKKIRFNPLNPSVEDIDIEDIAHALSFMVRANGHFPEFYSVAQHSICCAREAIVRKGMGTLALACLLHDASEAYLADITRPVKKHLPRYMEVEEVLQNLIYQKFLARSLNEEELQILKQIDDAMLFHEFDHYMNQQMVGKESVLYSVPNFVTRPFADVKAEFMSLFTTLQELSVVSE